MGHEALYSLEQPSLAVASHLKSASLVDAAVLDVRKRRKSLRPKSLRAEPTLGSLSNFFYRVRAIKGCCSLTTQPMWYGETDVRWSRLSKSV